MGVIGTLLNSIKRLFLLSDQAVGVAEKGIGILDDWADVGKSHSSAYKEKSIAELNAEVKQAQAKSEKSIAKLSAK